MYPYLFLDDAQLMFSHLLNTPFILILDSSCIFVHHAHTRIFKIFHGTFFIGIIKEMAEGLFHLPNTTIISTDLDTSYIFVYYVYYANFSNFSWYIFIDAIKEMAPQPENSHLLNTTILTLDTSRITVYCL